MTQPIHPMLERVARAIARECNFLGGEDSWKSELVAARAAVQALMEPTQDMIEIGMDYDEREIEIATGVPPTPDQCVAGQLRAMLKPLLGDEG